MTSHNQQRQHQMVLSQTLNSTAETVRRSKGIVTKRENW